MQTEKLETGNQNVGFNKYYFSGNWLSDAWSEHKGGGSWFSPSRPQTIHPVAVEPDEGHKRGGTKNGGGLEEGDLLSLETPGQLRGGRAGPEQQAH